MTAAPAPEPAPAASFARGAGLAAAAALCWSVAGVVVRQIPLPDVDVSFWRSAFMLGAVAPILLIRRRYLVRDLGERGGTLILSGALLAVTFVSFILALGLTSVANVMVVLAANPFVTALFARVFLGERIGGVTLAAMAVASGGLILTVVDQAQLGGLGGMAIAALVPLAFSLNTVLMRRNRSVSALPTLAAAALISALIVLPFAEPARIEAGHLPWLLILGPVQLLLGLYLFSRALAYVNAAQAALIAVLEMVLAPFWVWLAVGEAPSALTLAGGGIVIAAVAANGIAELRRRGRR